MNNGVKEREVTNSLKEIVKHTSRRKGAAYMPKQPHVAIKIAPKSSNGSWEDSSAQGSEMQDSDTSPLIDKVSPQFEHSQSGSAVSVTFPIQHRD
jgi:C6 transcription factor Pro1